MERVSSIPTFLVPTPQSLISENTERFGTKSPLKTILALCVAPMIFSFFTSIHDSIDLYFIGKHYGDAGVTIVSLSSLVRGLIQGLSNLTIQATTIKMSELISTKLFENASQLMVDLFRVNLILSLLIPGILCAILDPLLGSLGISNELLPDAKKYSYTIMAQMLFMGTSGLFNGVLMAEGKAILATSIQVCSTVLSLFILDPLFIFALNLPIWTLGFAFFGGQIFVSIGLAIYFLKGKSQVKPELKMIISKPAPEFLSTLKLCLPTIFTFGFGIASPMLLVSYSSAVTSEATAEAPTVISTSQKPSAILLMITMGCLSGFVPAANYAIQKYDWKRLKGLSLSTFGLMELVVVPIEILMSVKPRAVMSLWFTSESTMALVDQITPKIFYTAFLLPISEVIQSLMMVGGSAMMTIMTPAVKFVFMLFTLIGLKRKFPDNPSVMVNAIIVQDIAGLIFVVLIGCISFCVKRRQLKEAANDEPLLEDTDVVE